MGGVQKSAQAEIHKNVRFEQKSKDISGSQRRKYFLPVFGLDRQGYLCGGTSHCSWPMPRDSQFAGSGRKSIRAQVSSLYIFAQSHRKSMRNHTICPQIFLDGKMANLV